MTSYLLSAPALEPVTLAQTKEFLRIDEAHEDDFINSLIVAARIHVESITARALISQSWRVVRDCWPSDRTIHLPVGPLISLSAITTYDDDGNASTLPLAQFQPETEIAPARIFLPSNISGQSVMRQRGAIEIDYVAGFGVSSDDVPSDIKQAIFTLIAYWFEHRDAVVIAGSGSIVPAGFDMLVSAYRNVKL
ncbi:MAG: head-tail connector protein [Devosiaceae bacterium]|nr:head-tail connector protein [Devosiaceae bacterium]